MILLLSLVLALITLATSTATEREEIFLKAHIFAHLLEDKFKEQEVPLDMISCLSDADINQLAWATVGMRHRFKNAINRKSNEVNSNENTVEQNFNQEVTENPGQDLKNQGQGGKNSGQAQENLRQV